MEKPESQDPWHYPRPKLAEKYLKVFDIGLIAAQGLFAKRRMGKSESDLAKSTAGKGSKVSTVDSKPDPPDEE